MVIILSDGNFECPNKDLVYAFFKLENFDLKAIFRPEQGLFGSVSAGEKIYNKTDSVYGIPLYSLYGNNKKPNKDMLKNLDILVFDIQDIGIRSYTYISTMGLAMEAAQEVGLEFMVLDRPNPLGLKKIEGNILDMNFKSFSGDPSFKHNLFILSKLKSISLGYSFCRLLNIF